MFDRFFDIILAKNGKPGAWQEFLPLLVIFVIFILKNLGSFKFGKKEDDEQLERSRKARNQQPQQPAKRRYAPLDDNGRAIKRPALASPYVEPPDRDLDLQTEEPLAPAQATLMSDHDHTAEFAAVERYKARQAMLKKQLAEKRRIAAQIKQKAKAAAKTKPAPNPVEPVLKEPEKVEQIELIESEPEGSVDYFVTDPEKLRSAIIMSEIIGKPLALR